MEFSHFFPNFEKKISISKKKFKKGIFIQPRHAQSTTIAFYFSFNLMAKICVMAKKIIVQKIHNCAQ